jgi:hypothetical protein
MGTSSLFNDDGSLTQLGAFYSSFGAKSASSSAATPNVVVVAKPTPEVSVVPETIIAKPRGKKNIRRGRGPSLNEVNEVNEEE